MKLNQLMKAMLVVIPALAVSACQTSPESSTDSSGVVTDNQANNNGVEVGGAATAETLQEKMLAEKAVLNNENTVFFDFDRSVLSSSNKMLLNKHSEFLINNPSVNVIIEGHTDERGTPEYNIALGERRAIAVMKYLVSTGVPKGQLKTLSLGEEKPLDFSDTEAGYAKNRRAVIAY